MNNTHTSFEASYNKTTFIVPARSIYLVANPKTQKCYAGFVGGREKMGCLKFQQQHIAK